MMAGGKIVMALAGGVALGGAALAQEAPVAMLKWGTPVQLDTVREVNSADAFAGERLPLEVADDVVVDGHVVIAKGSPAIGEVSAVTDKGSWGQRGRLRVRLLYVHVGDRLVRITGDVAKEGRNGTAGTAAAVIAVGVTGGFLVTGTSAVIPPRTGLNAYVDEDVPLAFGPAPVARVSYAPADGPATVTGGAR